LTVEAKRRAQEHAQQKSTRDRLLWILAGAGALIFVLLLATEAFNPPL